MITAQVEKLADGGLEELIPLLATHYDDLSLHKDQGFPLDPQYGKYLAREAAGEVLYVTLREDGKIVGYFVGFILPGLHYQTCLTLHADIFFVLPDRRGHWRGVKLFRAVEKEARRRGVRLWQTGVKIHKDASRLFKLLGFEPTEIIHYKWLGD